MTALVPANTWTGTTACASPDSDSIAKGVTLTGVPAVIRALANDKPVWSITLNDGAAPANFTIDHYDAAGTLIEHPIAIDGTSGDVTLAHDPTQPLGVVTKAYVDAVALADAPSDGSTYARRNGAWTQTVPAFGGTFSGGVAFTAGAIFAGPANLNIGAGAAGQVLSAVGSGGALAWATLPIAADAPSDGQFYTRRNAGWDIAPGGMTDAPNDGTAYARKSAGWARLTHTDITDWAATLANYYPTSNPSGYQTAAQVAASLAPYALLTNVPPASTAPPIMDGVAAPGSAGNFARGDHVHPTDTTRAAASALASYLPLAGGALTGALTLAANPAAPLQPTTKQYVDALPVAMNDNGIINGNFAINQRVYVSAAALAAAAYGHDRWKAGTAGCTYTFTAALPDTAINITAGTLTQVIEAGMIEGGVYTLSWTGNAQARVYQGAPAGAYANSPVTTAALPAGVDTIVEFNPGTVVRVKLEKGSLVTPFNRQSLTKSLADCQRYYEKSYPQGVVAGAISNPGSFQFSFVGTNIANPFGCYIGFKVVKRAIPTLVFYSPVTGASGRIRDAPNNADVAPTSVVTGDGGFTVSAPAAVANANVNWTGHWASNAEL